MEFVSLSHAKKLKKVKEIAALLKGKSGIFAQLHEYIRNKEDLDDGLLDFLYNLVMSLIDGMQDQLAISEEKNVLKKLKSAI
jgi:hypothetical protein